MQDTIYNTKIYYDLSGRISQIIVFRPVYYDTLSRMLFNYTITNQLETVFYQNYNSNGTTALTQWNNSYFEQYLYQDTLLLRVLDMSWNSGANNYYTTYIEDFIYDGNNRITSTNEFHNMNAYPDSVNTTFIYDASSHLSSQIISSKDLGDTSWSTSKVDYSYDSHNFLTQTVISTQNPSTQLWKFSYHILQTNNSAGMPTEIVRKNFVDSNGTWLALSKMTYDYCSASPSSIEPKKESKFKIYPNPTSDIINIEFLNSNEKLITVYDLTGNTILQKTGFSNCTFSTSGWNTGIYFIKTENSVQKLIVQ